MADTEAVVTRFTDYGAYCPSCGWTARERYEKRSLAVADAREHRCEPE